MVLPIRQTVYSKMSISDIAKDANVSVSTVSRYFNRPELLSPEIAAKIEDIVSKRNYRPRIVRPGPKANGRIGIRNARRDCMDELKKLEKDHIITEDDLKDFQKDAEKVVGEFLDKLENALKNKEKEVMSI